MASISEMDVDAPPPPVIVSPVNGKPISPTSDPAPSLSPPPTAPSSASTLASLLSTALAQVESLKEKFKKEKKRADHFEVLASDYRGLLGEGSSATRNGESDAARSEQKDSEEKPNILADESRPAQTMDTTPNQLAKAVEQIKYLRELVSAAEQVRDEEIARRIAITDLWAQLNQYLDRLEIAGRDVRTGFDRIVKHGGGVMRDHGAMFRDIPQLSEGELMRVDRSYNVNGVLQPSAPYSSRKHDYPREERHGTRRPRSGSMDAYVYALGPNNKRVRYQDEHGHHHQSASGVSPTYYPAASHPPPPQPPGGSSLSPTNHIQQHQNAILQSMPFGQGQPQSGTPLAPSSNSTAGSRHRDRRHVDPAAMHPPDHHLYPIPGYEHPYRSQDHHREYRDDRKRRRRSRSYSRGRSPSRGSEASLDVDEMLLATATGDEQHPQANGIGVPGQVVMSGRMTERPPSSHNNGLVYDPREGSQFVHQVPPHNVSPHQQHLTTNHSSHHPGGPPPPRYPQPSPGPISGRLSPSVNPGSRPSSSRRGREQLRAEPTLRDDLGDRRDGRAPDGSSLIASSGSSGQVQYQTHVFAPVQTGAPVKKGKFNNTGGNTSNTNVTEDNYSNSPAPNPAPVAATNSTSSLPLTSVNLAPATSPYPPTNDQGQRICRQCGMPGRYKEGKCVEKWGPGPMGPGTVCDRCRKKMKRVERRGTMEQAQMLAAQQARSQASIGNGSFTFSGPQREGSSSAKLGRTDTVLIDSSGRHLEEPAVSSMRSTSNSRTVTSPSFAKSNKLSSGSRPTSKAASRAGSIVDGSKGSRRSSPLPPSRSNLSSSVTVLNSSRAHAASTSSVHSTGSGSVDIDADADGDADGDPDDPEAEVEGDIAALVDQAAPSPSRGGPKNRGNDEDVDSAVLAAVDDDPDDYDSPATTNALRKQQTARAGYGSAPFAADNHLRHSPSSGDGDAELDILEAVDAAEANSAASSSGPKTEDP